MRNNEDRLGVKQHLNDATPIQQSNELNLNFIVPTDFVELPSKGLFYSPSHPLHKCETVEIKQMTAKEEDILTSKSLLKKGVALDKLIESLVVDKSINCESLTVEDRNAIIVNARVSGYGPEYDTSVVCPSCSTKVKYSFNLSEKLELGEQEEQLATVDENGCFSVQLPATKWNVVCRALTGRDEKTLLNLGEVKKKSSSDSLLMEQLRLMVVSIQGVTSREAINDALEILPAGDSRYLRKVYSSVVKPFDLKQTFKCSSCEYEADMEVPLSADFFWFK